MGKSTISMAIFNSYVSLPEGIFQTNPTVPLLRLMLMNYPKRLPKGSWEELLEYAYKRDGFRAVSLKKKQRESRLKTSPTAKFEDPCRLSLLTLETFASSKYVIQDNSSS